MFKSISNMFVYDIYILKIQLNLNISNLNKKAGIFKTLNS